MTEIIAEIGSSHAGSKEKALALIRFAAEAGADWAKFQLFTGDDLWHSSDARLETTRQLSLPEAWLPELKETCESYGLKFLCTPFSPRAVEVLERLNVGAYKIASGDLTYLPLVEAVGKTGKPVFLSVGASGYKEINAAWRLLPKQNVVLLHCVPGYPTPPSQANLPRILDLSGYYVMHEGWSLDMKRTLGDRSVAIGLSSHLREYYVDAAMVAYRVHCIEKHIDLPGRPGPESPHSLDPEEFALFVAMVRDIESAMNKHADFSEPELYARDNYRRNPADWLRPFKR